LTRNFRSQNPRERKERQGAAAKNAKNGRGATAKNAKNGTGATAKKAKNGRRATAKNAKNGRGATARNAKNTKGFPNGFEASMEQTGDTTGSKHCSPNVPLSFSAASGRLAWGHPLNTTDKA
jgi:hypothetical protein